MADSEQVGRYFDAFAADYKKISTAGGWQSNVVFGQVLSDLMLAGAVQSPRALLDVGAGTGGTIDEVLKHASPERIVAVDVSKEMVRGLTKAYAVDARVQVIHSSALSYLQTSDEMFNMITAMSVMQFIRQPEVAVKGLARCLRLGGHAWFSYDPIIANHPQQSTAQEVAYNASADTKVEIYRQHPHAVEGMLTDNGFAVRAHQLYAPRPSVDPSVIAGMVVAERL